MYEINGICYAGEPKYLPKVVGVRAMKDYLLWTRFSDGAQRIYDMKHLLQHPAFQPLKEEAVFRDVYIDYFAPVWCEGKIDLDPETIYEKGVNPQEKQA